MDPNTYTTPFQLTKSLKRDLYPSINPKNPAISAKGKTILITGATGGLGGGSPTNDKGIQTGGLSLYLAQPKADYLKGSFISVNWDVDEMEAHKQEIAEQRLLKLGFLGAKLGPEGHQWSASLAGSERDSRDTAVVAKEKRKEKTPVKSSRWRSLFCFS